MSRLILLSQIWAVFEKEVRSELKTRYGLNAVFLFILNAVTMLAFSLANERLSDGLASGLLWVILFFSAMTGLSKSFVSEEERGTGLLLRALSTPTAVYFGKLMYNIVQTTVLYGVAIALFRFFFNTIEIKTASIFWSTFILGSVATAGATTIISAIVARASTKNALFSALSFPILLPVIITGIEATYQALTGVAFEFAQTNLLVIFSYSVVLISLSSMLFDFVWKD